MGGFLEFTDYYGKYEIISSEMLRNKETNNKTSNERDVTLAVFNAAP